MFTRIKSSFSGLQVFQLSPQRYTVDPEDFRGPGAVAAGAVQYPANILRLSLFQHGTVQTRYRHTFMPLVFQEHQVKYRNTAECDHDYRQAGVGEADIFPLWLGMAGRRVCLYCKNCVARCNAPGWGDQIGYTAAFIDPCLMLVTI